MADTPSTAPVVLAVGGSDPSGAAGIQADIKTITNLGGYAATAITGITVQNSQGFYQSEALNPKMVVDQMEAVFNDLPVVAVKLGYLFNADIIDDIGQLLLERATDIPIILDPVSVGKKTDRVLDIGAMRAMKVHLFPQITLITPNIKEVEYICGMEIDSEDDLEMGAQMVLSMSPAAALVKGASLGSTPAMDILASEEDITLFEKQLVETENTSGAGCALASAIATYLAFGDDLEEAIRKAENYVERAIKTGPNLGSGCGPINHLVTP